MVVFCNPNELFARLSCGIEKNSVINYDFPTYNSFRGSKGGLELAIFGYSF